MVRSAPVNAMRVDDEPTKFKSLRAWDVSLVIFFFTDVNPYLISVNVVSQNNLKN